MPTMGDVDTISAYDHHDITQCDRIPIQEGVIYSAMVGSHELSPRFLQPKAGSKSSTKFHKFPKCRFFTAKSPTFVLQHLNQPLFLSKTTNNVCL